MEWKIEVHNYCKLLKISPPSLLLTKSELIDLLERKNWKRFIDSFFTNTPSKETIREIRGYFRDILENFWNKHACGTCDIITIDGEKPICVISIKDRFTGDKIVIKHELSHHFLEIIGISDGEKNRFNEEQADTLENIPVSNWKNYLRLHC